MALYAKGKYKAKAKDWKLGLAGTGKEQVGVEFEFSEGELAGKHISWYGYFTEGTFEQTMKSLRACGWKGTNLAELGRADCGLDANEVELVVDHEESTKKADDGSPIVYARVRWVNPIRGLAMKEPMQQDQAAAFAARMKAQILAYDQKAPKTAAKADDDFPPGM